MKLLAFFLLSGSIGVMAQPADILRDITVMVVDRDGKPVPGVAVQNLSAADSAAAVGVTDFAGIYTFPGLRTGDSISVVLPKIGEVYIPVDEGASFIQLTLESSRDPATIIPELNTVVDLGYGSRAMVKNSTAAATVISNVQQVIRETGATTVAELLDLNGVTRGRDGLVFLDGIESNIEEVEGGFFYQLETIVVDKIGASYSFRGSNGAMQFYTKRYVMMMSQ